MTASQITTAFPALTFVNSVSVTDTEDQYFDLPAGLMAYFESKSASQTEEFWDQLMFMESWTNEEPAGNEIHIESFGVIINGYEFRVDADEILEGDEFFVGEYDEATALGI